MKNKINYGLLKNILIVVLVIVTAFTTISIVGNTSNDVEQTTQTTQNVLMDDSTLLEVENIILSLNNKVTALQEALPLLATNEEMSVANDEMERVKFEVVDLANDINNLQGELYQQIQQIIASSELDENNIEHLRWFTESLQEQVNIINNSLNTNLNDMVEMINRLGYIENALSSINLQNNFTINDLYQVVNNIQEQYHNYENLINNSFYQMDDMWMRIDDLQNQIYNMHYYTDIDPVVIQDLEMRVNEVEMILFAELDNMRMEIDMMNISQIEYQLSNLVGIKTSAKFFTHDLTGFRNDFELTIRQNVSTNEISIRIDDRFTGSMSYLNVDTFESTYSPYEQFQYRYIGSGIEFADIMLNALKVQGFGDYYNDISNLLDLTYPENYEFADYLNSQGFYDYLTNMYDFTQDGHMSSSEIVFPTLIIDRYDCNVRLHITIEKII